MHRYGHLFSVLKAFRNTHGHPWTLLRLSHGENRVLGGWGYAYFQVPVAQRHVTASVYQTMASTDVLAITKWSI